MTKGPYVLSGNTWFGYGRADIAGATGTDGFTDATATTWGTQPVWRGFGASANNVGIPAGRTALTIAAADFVQAAGKVHEPPAGRFWDVTGKLTLTQPGQTFRYLRSRYSVAGTTDQTGNFFTPIAATNMSSANRFEFCEVKPDNPGKSMAGAFGKRMELYRCAIVNTTDGVDLYSTASSGDLQVSVVSCWIGNLAWYADDAPVHQDGTHNDGFQCGAGSGIEIIGSFLQGIRYNVLNPGNVTLDAEWKGFTVANGNGVTPLLVDRFVAGASGSSAQSGFGILLKAEQAYPVGITSAHHSWLWNWGHGICGQSNDAQFGQQDVIINDFHDNIFGGRWLREGSNTFNPIRYDLRTTFNGVRRSATGFFQDTANNRWAVGANPGATNPDGSRHDAGTLVWHRVNTRLGDGAIA